MSSMPAMHSPIRRQSGAATVAIAMLIMFVLSAAIYSIMTISGTGVSDAAKNEEQIAALFLAESGVESAKATIRAANDSSSDLTAACTGMTVGAQTLGRGTFQFTPTPTCSGMGCSECNVVVEGAITGTDIKRIIRTTISTVNTQGTDGCGSTPSLPTLTTTKDQAAVFSNLAYRAKTSSQCGADTGGANASISNCTVTGVAPNPPCDPAAHPPGFCTTTTSCLPTTNGWDIATTGTNNVSGMGIVTDDLNTAGTAYTVAQELSTNSGPVNRHYVQTGVAFYPPTLGIVTFTGSYGASGHTTSTSQLTGDVRANWNCAPVSGTTTSDMAAGSNTLVYGFSSSSADTTTLLSGVTFGVTPMRRQLSMTGTADANTGGGSSTFYLYSQIWYAYNSAYYPTGATAANTGAKFTGTIGTEFKAHTDNSATPTSFTLDENLDAWETLTSGDTIRSADGTTVYGTLGAWDSSSNPAGTAGAKYGYTHISGGKLGNNTKVTTQTNVLRLTSAPSVGNGSLANSDTITDSATDSIPYGTITYQTGTGSGPNTAGALYTLSSAGWVGSGAANNLYSSRNSTPSRTVIEFTGTVDTTGNGTPAVGTALTSLGGTGSFGSTTVTGGISGNTLTLDSGALATLYTGDALFGANVKPNTTITSGGVSQNTFQINPPQTAASGTIIARTAVVSWINASPSSITVSRPTRISGATAVCGGVCALLTYNAATTFTLSGADSSRDWSSGFACLSGVDASSIKTLGTVGTKRTSWSELVR